MTERRHHAPNEPVRTLYLAKESGKGQLETTRDDFQIAGGDVSFSVLHIRQITSIQPEFLCHLNLRPAALLSELSQSPPNPDADVIGHNLSSWLEDSAPQSGYKQHRARGCFVRGLVDRRLRTAARLRTDRTGLCPTTLERFYCGETPCYEK